MSHDQLHARVQALAGEIQGQRVKFDGIHWTCEVGMEMQIDTEDGEVYEEHTAEFSGTIQDDPADHRAEVWDWVVAATSTRVFRHDEEWFSASRQAFPALKAKGYTVGPIERADVQHHISVLYEGAAVGVILFSKFNRLTADAYVVLFPDVDPGPGLGRDEGDDTRQAQDDDHAERVANRRKYGSYF
jgi:hypothetical protein